MESTQNSTSADVHSWLFLVLHFMEISNQNWFAQKKMRQSGIFFLFVLVQEQR